ncbi:MAG: hypothetical protein F6J87_00110 [Spirulina sp. SIO3F2]|nr:hypothetical protein [Spirulina sp. SIO3F2]
MLKRSTLAVLCGFIVCPLTLSIKPALAQESTPEILETVGLEHQSNPTATVTTNIQSAELIALRARAQAYEMIQVGMTLAQVESLIGGKGEEISSSEYNGSVTASYNWIWDGGLSSINVITQDGVVVGKSTTDYRLDAAPKPNMSRAQAYERVQIGMTLQQVQSLLGTGRITRISELNGNKTLAYKWQWDSTRSLTVTLQNDVTKAKARIGNALAPGSALSAPRLSPYEAYDAIQAGVTLAQLEAQLGKPRQMSFSQFGNSISSTYVWVWNRNGLTYVEVTVSNGQITHKSTSRPEQ